MNATNNSIESKLPASVEKLIAEIRQLFTQNPKATGEFHITGIVNEGGVVNKKIGILHTK